jgi:hypothetical protein
VLSAVQPDKGPQLTSLQEAPPEEYSSGRWEKHSIAVAQIVKSGRISSKRREIQTYKERGIFFGFFFLFMYDIQHCFICRPSDSTVSEDAGIKPRTVATTALAVRRSNHSARSHPLINTYVDNDLLYLLPGMAADSVRTGRKDDTLLVRYRHTIHIFNLLWRQSTHGGVACKWNVELVLQQNVASHNVYVTKCICY